MIEKKSINATKEMEEQGVDYVGENNKKQDQSNICVKRRDIINWIKQHRKQLIIIGISIPVIIAIAFGIKNKDELIQFWKSLEEDIKNGSKYSRRWFKNATDAELDMEREKVRLAFCSPGGDYCETLRLEGLLQEFDNEMSLRAWGDEIPHAPSNCREHGWYLPNDD